MREPTLMALTDGPLGGLEMPPHEGWPCPGGLRLPDGYPDHRKDEPLMHEYVRVGVEEVPDGVRHIYRFQTPKEVGVA